MHLWLLRPCEGLPKEESPWEPWYDKAFGFVVRAETEDQARKMAAGKAGDERPRAWTNPLYSTCRPLMIDGEAGVILSDFQSA